jgi:8-oxo-dGTP pyrophosphatase MutT (NUDIX family)
MMSPPYPSVKDLGLPVDLVVSAYIVHSGHVLLVDHRALGCWLPVGGHVEIGETSDGALFREIWEETGLWLGPEDVLQLRHRQPDSAFHNRRSLLTPMYVDIHDYPTIPGHRHLALIYYLRSPTPEVRCENLAHKAARWFTREDLYDPAFRVPAPILWHAWDAIDSFRRFVSCSSFSKRK